MDSRNTYAIEITFKNSNSSTLFNGNIDYRGSKKYQDYLKIEGNKISIEAHRSSIIDLQSIFYNHNSSLYIQIVKSLAYYYTVIKKYVPINKLSIKRKREADTLDEKVFFKKDINQIVSKGFKIDYKINPTYLEVIFEETRKGKELLNSLSHFLSAKNATSDDVIFERLWKSFNTLYRLIGKKNTEFDCLIETRLFINNNPTLFKLSLPKVSALDKREFRDKLRWRGLIINNYPEKKDTKNYKNSILRYTDYRIMNVYNETIGTREKYLKEKGYYSKVTKHLNTHLKANTKADHELLSVLTLRYMYFVRNKSFHGEKIDSTFRLTMNKEINEYAWLNDKLEPFIVDLINGNKHF